MIQPHGSEPIVHFRGSSLNDILVALRSGMTWKTLANATVVREDIVWNTLIRIWETYLEYEEVYGRNRWREMKERGGFPPEAYLQIPVPEGHRQMHLYRG